MVSSRELWIAGYTKYSGFPTTEDAFDRTFNNEDGYFMMIDPISCSLNYSSFFGGSSQDSIYKIVMTSQGEIVCAGSTYSANFPTMNALLSEKPGDRDGFVFKLILNETTSTAFSSTSTITPTTSSIYTSMDMIYVALAGVSLGVIVLVVIVTIVRKKRTL